MLKSLVSQPTIIKIGATNSEKAVKINEDSKKIIKSAMTHADLI